MTRTAFFTRMSRSCSCTLPSGSIATVDASAAPFLPAAPGFWLRSTTLSSAYSIEPPPSGSNESKSPSTSSTGTSSPSSAIAFRNSILVTLPSPGRERAQGR